MSKNGIVIYCYSIRLNATLLVKKTEYLSFIILFSPTFFIFVKDEDINKKLSININK